MHWRWKIKRLIRHAVCYASTIECTSLLSYTHNLVLNIKWVELPVNCLKFPQLSVNVFVLMHSAKGYIWYESNLSMLSNGWPVLVSILTLTGNQIIQIWNQLNELSNYGYYTNYSDYDSIPTIVTTILYQL